MEEKTERIAAILFGPVRRFTAEFFFTHEISEAIYEAIDTALKHERPNSHVVTIQINKTI